MSFESCRVQGGGSLLRLESLDLFSLSLSDTWDIFQHMVVYIDRRIVNNPCGAAILDTLQRNEPPVKYSVENQSFAGVITFARETSQIVETRDKVRLFIRLHQPTVWQKYPN